MKTITIKLPDEKVNELMDFIKKENYPSKSEFIRNLIMEKIESSKKEKIGWMVLGEKSMEKIWNNKRDDEIWSKYL